MRTKIFITTLLVGLSINLFAEGKKMLESKLKEATVFFQGAELVHTVNVSLQDGNNELYISGLSSSVDRNSIKIKTPSGVMVSAFEFSIDYLIKKEDAIESSEIIQLKKSIKDYETQISIIDVSTKVNKELLDVLQKSILKSAEGSEEGLSINDLMKTLDYYKTKSLELEGQLRLDMEKRVNLVKDLEKFKSQLNQITLVNNKTSGILKLNLLSSAIKKGDLVISYYTPAASWVPYYDINVSSTDQPIKITSKGKIRQTSGFDWDNIKLALSTSQPNSGNIAPLFYAWFLNYKAPINVRAAGKVFKQNNYAYIDGVQAQSIVSFSETDQANDLTMDNYVIQNENQLNITYNIDLPYSIPGSGKEQNIVLKNQDIPADFKYYCAPKLSRDTYVLAEVSDWQKLNLLSGSANITYNGTYVGETFIDVSSTNEKLSLTLGTDSRVPVKREKLQDYSSTKFLGSDVRQIFTYQLTVRNNQNIPVKMVLKDQYPKSTLKEINVELLKDTTDPSFNNEDVGVLSWEFEMKPGEVKTFKLSYSVKYPKGKTLNL